MSISATEGEMGNDICVTDLLCPALHLVSAKHRWVKESTKGRIGGDLE